jgi:sulfur relay (sulfurtransferase) DsrF/TusC family protein
MTGIVKHYRSFLGAIALLAMFTNTQAATWSFAVTGDDRTDIRAPQVDPTGIHTEILAKQLKAITESKPAFLLFTGDLVYGDSIRIPRKIGEQFSDWKKLVSENAPGLTILPVRGNHETKGDPEGAAWLEAFEPMISSNSVTYFPGQKGFSYSYIVPQHPDTAVIAVDQYNPAALNQVDLKGLESAFKELKAKGVKNFFVFSHEMAFTAGCHPDSENMAAHPTDRDKFLELLHEYSCEYFFVGHDHFYDWMQIRNWRWPADYALNQIVAGTAGAPFYPDKTYFGAHDGYDLLRLDHKQNTYGYLLVTVNDQPKPGEKPVTVTFETVAP